MSSGISVLLDDGLQIPRGTGIGKYSEHLARALEECGAYVDFVGYGPDSSGREVRRLSYLRYLNSEDYRRRAEAYNLCIFTNYAMPFRKLATRTAVTIHDLAVFDCPRSLPRLYLPYGRAMIKNAIKRADSIVTVSKTMSEDIRGRFPRDAKKVSWAWPGVYDHVHAGGNGNPYDDVGLEKITKFPFFLMVGTVEKRKNVEFVIRAFAKFRAGAEAGRDWRLVLAGRPGFGFDDIERTVSDCGCEDSVLFTGYVSDDDCANLYRDARALVFPTVYEGFGSIQNECMAMGLPIVLSDIPTNLEVSRDYGIYFHLGDVEDLVRAFCKAAAQKGSKRLSDLAIKYLPEFSWEQVARCYLDAIGDVCSGKGGLQDVSSR